MRGEDRRYTRPEHETVELGRGQPLQMEDIGSTS